MYKVFIGSDLHWETDSYSNALEVLASAQAWVSDPRIVTLSYPY